MKTKIILLMTFYFVGMSGCKASNNQVKRNNDTIPSIMKTYSNTALGLTFQYPNTWSKYGEDANAINRNGEVMSINISFIDTISKSIFNLAYHLAPYGAELYKFAQDQFNSSQGWYANSGAKQIEVAGNKAIESFNTMSSDIKGNIYDPPLRFVHIIFLDKLQTGEFDLQFNTPLPESDTEIAKFNQLLSSIKFTN